MELVNGAMTRLTGRYDGRHNKAKHETQSQDQLDAILSRDTHNVADIERQVEKDEERIKTIRTHIIEITQEKTNVLVNLKLTKEKIARIEMDINTLQNCHLNNWFQIHQKEISKLRKTLIALKTSEITIEEKMKAALVHVGEQKSTVPTTVYNHTGSITSNNHNGSRYSLGSAGVEATALLAGQFFKKGSG